MPFIFIESSPKYRSEKADDIYFAELYHHISEAFAQFRYILGR